jgi:hypothetical protein
MWRKILIGCLAGVVVFSELFIPCSDVSATGCADLEFIFARGSGQDYGAREFQKFREAAEAELESKRFSGSYHFYELEYPAVGIDPTDFEGLQNILGAWVSAGTANRYGDSVEAGVSELSNYLDSIRGRCSNTKFVLAGYSQGAQVITDGFSAISPERVLYAGLFGDPKLYLSEGYGLDPPACSGNGLSWYRENVPNCRTYQGALLARTPYIPASWFSGRVGLWCMEKDFVCGSSSNVFQNSGHGRYGEFMRDFMGLALRDVSSGFVNYEGDLNGDFGRGEEDGRNEENEDSTGEASGDDEKEAIIVTEKTKIIFLENSSQTEPNFLRYLRREFDENYELAWFNGDFGIIQGFRWGEENRLIIYSHRLYSDDFERLREFILSRRIKVYIFGTVEEREKWIGFLAEVGGELNGIFSVMNDERKCDFKYYAEKILKGEKL